MKRMKKKTSSLKREKERFKVFSSKEKDEKKSFFSNEELPSLKRLMAKLH